MAVLASGLLLTLVGEMRLTRRLHERFPTKLDKKLRRARRGSIFAALNRWSLYTECVWWQQSPEWIRADPPARRARWLRRLGLAVAIAGAVATIAVLSA
jgi:hypothetical protein